MVTPEQKALLPKMTGGEGTTASPGKPAVSAAPKPPVQPPALAPEPVVTPKPDHDEFWIDDRGSIWRKTPVPAIILTVNNYCTQAQVDAILKTLLKG